MNMCHILMLLPLLCESASTESEGNGQRLHPPVAAFHPGDDAFFPHCFYFFPSKLTFPPKPPLFFSISVNTALTKTLTYPSTLGEAYPKRRCALHDVP